MKTIKMLAVAMMISLFGAGAAQAQNKPEGALDEAGLKAMLEQLGYDLRPVSLSGDRTGYYIKVPFQGQQAEMFMQVSPNGANIWATLNLAEIKPEHHLEGSKLIRLLQLNQVHGPCHFYVTPSGKMLCLTRGLFNKDLNAKELRQHIESLLNTATTTIPDWDTAKWGAPAPTAPVVPE